MLSTEDRRAIEGLFDRLAEAERRSPARDRDAEDLINRELVRQPAAPYYLAQTVLVQQDALQQAEQRIAELEAQVRQRSRGLFGGLFDDGRRGADPVPQGHGYDRRNRGPWDREGQQPATRGGGFLEGAAQTALGVAGGVLLGNMIGSIFSSGSAHAAEGWGGDTSSSTADSAPADTGGNDDFGADFGDGGGFDTGGDF